MRIKQIIISKEPVIIKLVPEMEGVVTQKRFLDEASKILGSNNSSDKLMYEDSRFVEENMLLSRELSKNAVKAVRFLINGEEIEVTSENIEQIREELLREGSNLRGIPNTTRGGNKEAVAAANKELFERA